MAKVVSGHQLPSGRVIFWTDDGIGEVTMLKKRDIEEMLSTNKKLSSEVKERLIKTIGLSNVKKERVSSPIPRSSKNFVGDSSRQSIPLSSESKAQYRLGTIINSPDGLRKRMKTVWKPIKPKE